MAVKVVKFKDWIFEVDFDRTVEVYKSMVAGGPECCNCNNCKNFAEHRETIYPNLMKNLLSDLGIDYHKEIEVCHYGKLENGLHRYGGWFHFKGKIVEGKDCKIELPNGGSTFETIEIMPNFRIAFMKGNAMHLFDIKEKNDLIQVEFLANSRWVIDKELESQ